MCITCFFKFFILTFSIPKNVYLLIRHLFWVYNFYLIVISGGRRGKVRAVEVIFR